MRSGRLREGAKTRELEEAFKSRTGVSHAVAASSGTAALHLAYLAMLQPGDEVLVPSFTFIATASMIVMAGGRPVFCDIEPDTWTLDPAEIEKRLTPKTKAIAGVHLFGNACDIATIQKIADKRGLGIIWDAAQALGTSYQGRDLAQYRDAVCFSFYPTKNMTTGEGGMVATNDEVMAAKIRLLKNHGHTEKYVHQIVGFNYRMSEVEAAIGKVQLSQLDSFIEKRKKLANIYIEAFRGNASFKIQSVTAGANHSYNYFSIALNTDQLSVSRDEFAKALDGEGVQNAVHYPRGLHQQPAFSGLANGVLPHAESLSGRILSLPMSPFLNEVDIRYASEKVLFLIKKFARRHVLA
ncbi:MAG: DegT/DnrJ/EryC1/StrS family aminotransferase [Candidatus Omnitrophica bacterium]|nr:DegT/DnrJ/EryC1/StrS family aminotransferase [Candidatus Omnitrophota bacterium]